MIDEQVILVDKANNKIGTMNKSDVHTATTPLHRGFSVFLFGSNKKLLLSLRSSNKKTWPNFWTNSVCGHPLPDENIIDAAKRRIQDELGISATELKVILPDYSYRFEEQGVVENEICPVLVGKIVDDPRLNSDEVQQIQWIDWAKWLDEVLQSPKKYSPWAVEETKLLDQNEEFQNFYKNI